MQESSGSDSDIQYNPSRRTKFLLMGLLIILNIVMRIPSIPHEKGYDSFFIHSLANSVSNFGVAKWWINWMSVFGLYPYSYASAVPFTLSGISQLTGIRMEIAILLFCVLLGLFSIFASYSLTTVLYDSFLHRFLFTAIFSLSAGTVNLTTWEITTRAQIIVFLPFIMYLVFQIIKKLKVRYVLLFIMTAVLLLATHHFVYIVLFYSGVIVVTSLIYKHSKRNNYAHIQKTLFKKINLNYVYISIAFLLIFLIFLFGSKWGLITAGSRYAWIIDIGIITGRNVGIILPLSIGGLTYLVLKKDKLSEEWAILICLLPTLIFSFNQTYGYMTTYLFVTLLGSVGFLNIIKNQKRNSRITVTIIIIVLIMNVTFSTFFAHYRLGMKGGYSDWYMREETYLTGEWIKNHISEDKIAVDNGFESDRLVASYGGKPIKYSDDILNYINGFVTLDQQNIVKYSPFSKEFYFDNPYVLSTDSSGVLNWISLFPITDKRTKGFIENLNISYYYEDTKEYNVLFGSLPENKNKIYDGGRMRLWEN
ncbi:hypothetical protein [Methanosarcina mazei]|nr:hypothetical protein [Methanosarcina mazei]